MLNKFEATNLLQFMFVLHQCEAFLMKLSTFSLPFPQPPSPPLSFPSRKPKEACRIVNPPQPLQVAQQNASRSVYSFGSFCVYRNTPEPAAQKTRTPRTTMPTTRRHRPSLHSVSLLGQTLADAPASIRVLGALVARLPIY